MSTNINITVGDNALLDAAKQQQAANRQAQLNREASTRLEGQATAARTAALAAQGRDANGKLVTGASFTQPQIDRRPAANRISGDIWIMYFRAAPTFTLLLDATIDDWGATGTLRNNDRLLATQPFYAYGDTRSQFNPQTNPLSFLAGDGPSGANVIRSKTNLVLDAGRPRFEPPEDSYPPLRNKSYTFTLEADVRFTAPNDFPYTYRLGSDFSTTTEGLETYRCSAFIEVAAFGGPLTLGLVFGTGFIPRPPTVVIPGPSTLGNWARIALVYDSQIARLFINGQLVHSFNTTAPETSPSFVQFFARADVGVNTSAAFVDCTGVIFTPKALYTDNYTPQPLKLV